MTFDSLVAYYQQNVSPGADKPGTDAWNNRFNSWTSQLEKELNLPGGDFNDPASGWASIDPGKLDEFTTTGGGPGTTTTIPLEQDLMGRVLDQYVYPGMEQDKASKAAAATALAEGNAALDATSKLNAVNAASGFSAEAYLRNNNADPSTWPAARASLQAIVDAGLAPTLDAAAEYHYNTYGKAEGKKSGVIGTLANENANADTVAANLAATATTQGADNQKVIDSTNRTLGAAIDTSAASRTGAVDTQTAALRTGQTAQEGDKIRALDGRSAETLGALDSRTAQLGSAIDANEQARQRTLAVLNSERLGAAEGQVTGINLGLERTKDQLAAQEAMKGYIGGGAMADANLARAVVGARQNAAGVVGQARVINATDVRSLGDDVAGMRLSNTGNDATDRFGIKSGAATDRFGIKSGGADSRFSITSGDATARTGITNDAAGQRLTLAGATGDRTLSNAFAMNAGVADAKNKGTQMRSDYYDANGKRQLVAALAPASVAANRMGLQSTADGMGRAGLDHALSALGFFTSSATPTQAGSFTTTPSQAGNDLAGLGAGITGGAISIGNANKWWQTPKTPAPSGSAAKPNP